MDIATHRQVCYSCSLSCLSCFLTIKPITIVTIKYTITSAIAAQTYQGATFGVDSPGKKCPSNIIAIKIEKPSIVRIRTMLNLLLKLILFFPYFFLKIATRSAKLFFLITNHTRAKPPKPRTTTPPTTIPIIAPVPRPSFGCSGISGAPPPFDI